MPTSRKITCAQVRKGRKVYLGTKGRAILNPSRSLKVAHRKPIGTIAAIPEGTTGSFTLTT